MMARPSGYSDEIADCICAAIVDSDYGIEQVCEEDDTLPSPSTVYRWIVNNDAFREKYSRAKEAQGHVQADRANRDALDATDPQLGRLRWNARCWQASKLTRKTFGDKVVQEHTGADGAPLPALTVKFVSADDADKDT